MSIDKDYLKYLEQFVTDKRKNLFREVLSNRTRHFAVVLEDLYQKHNTSAVTRSCEVFGVQDLYTIENKYKTYVSAHVGKGSHKWLHFNRFKTKNFNTTDCLEDLRAKGYQIVATSPHHHSIELADFDVTKKSAFVFGVEKEGVSDYMLEQADVCLKIPMYGFTESLNVSVAAAIILSDTVNRMRRSEVDWALSSEEQEALYLEWVEKSIKSIKKIKAHYYDNLNT